MDRSLSVPASNVGPAREVGRLTSELPLDGPGSGRLLHAYTRNLLEALGRPDFLPLCARGDDQTHDRSARRAAYRDRPDPR